MFALGEGISIPFKCFSLQRCVSERKIVLHSSLMDVERSAFDGRDIGDDCRQALVGLVNTVCVYSEPTNHYSNHRSTGQHPATLRYTAASVRGNTMVSHSGTNNSGISYGQQLRKFPSHHVTIFPRVESNGSYLHTREQRRMCYSVKQLNNQ